MGIIKKQGVFSLFFTYFGFLIGAVNTFFLLPNYLEPEQVGLTKVLLDVGLTISGFATLGSFSVSFKFFPFYRDNLPKNKNDLFTRIALVSLLGFTIIAGLTIVFKQQIIAKFITKSPLFVDYYYLIYPFSFLLLCFSFFEAYCWSVRKTIMSTIQKELVLRVVTTLLILAFILHLFNFHQFIIAYSLLYFVPAVWLALYLHKQGELYFAREVSNVTRKLKKRMINYGGFVFAGSSFFIVTQALDSLFISGIKGLDNTAVYTIAAYMATVIQVPQRSIISIATPILSQSWKDKDYANIRMIYEKSSLNMLIAALFIFLIIWINLDTFFSFLPKEYAAGKWVIFILGISKIIDMGTGLNNVIIGTSNFWKFDFYTSAILIFLIVPGNYFLITHFGILGAALSNLIAFTIYDIIRLTFIWRKFNLFPFSINTLKAILAGALSYLAVYLVPDMSNLYVHSMVISIVFVGIFAALILGGRVSEDINGFWKMALKKITKGR